MSSGTKKYLGLISTSCPNPLELTVGSPVTLVMENVYTSYGSFAPAYCCFRVKSWYRTDRQTEGRTDGRARPVIRPIVVFVWQINILLLFLLLLVFFRHCSDRLFLCVLTHCHILFTAQSK